LLGPVRVISKELPGIRCRNIDLSLSQDPLESARQIIQESASSSISPIVAYRDSGRWIESFESASISDSSAGIKLREKGAYLITGGAGGIGLLLAERLAKQCKAKLALLGRSEFPPESEWQRLAEDSTTAKSLRQKLAKLLEFRSLGSEVIVLSADVASSVSIRRAVSIAESRFGKINGIIHAAGSIQDGPLQLKASDSAASVLAPKIFGTLALHELFLAKEMDFLALVSSVSAVFPPAGQVDYAAANAFLDSFAQSVRDRAFFQPTGASGKTSVWERHFNRCTRCLIVPSWKPNPSPSTPETFLSTLTGSSPSTFSNPVRRLSRAPAISNSPRGPHARRTVFGLGIAGSV